MTTPRPGEELFDDVGKLPPAHFFRRFIEDAGDRLVGVENRLEPHRTQSSRRLHQAILETVEATGGKRYAFKPQVAIARHQ